STSSGSLELSNACSGFTSILPLRASPRSHADDGAFGRLDAEALPLQVQPLAGKSKPCGGFFHPAAALFQGMLQHGAFEMLGCRGQRLVEPDDDFGGIEGALGRRDR